jgi:hypothetical protein
MAPVSTPLGAGCKIVGSRESYAEEGCEVSDEALPQRVQHPLSDQSFLRSG